MLRDPSIQAVACNLLCKNFPSTHAIYTSTPTPIHDLPNIFAQFGQVRAVVKISNPVSTIIVFMSAEVALRAKAYKSQTPSIHIKEYVRPLKSSRRALIFTTVNTSGFNGDTIQGREGMDEIQEVASLSPSQPVLSPTLIRQDWTLTPGGQYVFGTASLDLFLQHRNLQHSCWW